jgi:hypothetical protein
VLPPWSVSVAKYKIALEPPGPYSFSFAIKIAAWNADRGEDGREEAFTVEIFGGEQSLQITKIAYLQLNTNE